MLAEDMEKACKRSVEEIEAGNFDLLFANSSLPYNIPYVMRHARIPKVLYLQEPRRYLYEASPILPWVDGVHDQLKLNLVLRSGGLLADYLMIRG